MSGRRIPPKMAYCLFCGLDPRADQFYLLDNEVQQILTAHMAKEHFQAFALDCVPWGSAGVDECSAYDTI
jgi:hypothetical protein